MRPFVQAYEHAEKLREEGYKKGWDEGYAVGFQAAEQKFNPEAMARTESGLIVPAGSVS